jgi:hypothetical protein
VTWTLADFVAPVMTKRRERQRRIRLPRTQGLRHLIREGFKSGIAGRAARRGGGLSVPRVYQIRMGAGRPHELGSVPAPVATFRPHLTMSYR